MNWKDDLRIAAGLIQKSDSNKFLDLMTSLVLRIFNFNSRLKSHELWTRNSFELGAHVPLLSDIDLTCYHPDPQVPKTLLKQKLKYLLIGEINYYHPKITTDLLKLANPLELKRDPKLCQMFNLDLQPTEDEKDIFLVRQILSDLKWLAVSPEVRLKKWNYLFLLLDYPKLKVISYPEISNQLKSVDVKKELTTFFTDLSLSQNIYQLGKTASWKYLIPQNHIWDLNDLRDQKYLLLLSPHQARITLLQIKWEFWGIGTHFYWLNQQVALDHLSRLYLVAEFMNAESETLISMRKVIKFIQEVKLTNN